MVKCCLHSLSKVLVNLFSEWTNTSFCSNVQLYYYPLKWAKLVRTGNNRLSREPKGLCGVMHTLKPLVVVVVFNKLYVTGRGSNLVFYTSQPLRLYQGEGQREDVFVFKSRFLFQNTHFVLS